VTYIMYCKPRRAETAERVNIALFVGDNFLFVCDLTVIDSVGIADRDLVPRKLE